MARVVRHTETLAKTGVADESFLSALLPSSTGEWIDEVKRRTGLNTMIAWWNSRNTAPECDEALGETDGLRQAERADALYSLLAAHHCCKKKHKTLLQLSGWGDSEEEKTVFQMFLSDCSDDGWQRATCSFEKSVTNYLALNSRGSPVANRLLVQRHAILRFPRLTSAPKSSTHGDVLFPYCSPSITTGSGWLGRVQISCQSMR